MKHVEIYTTRYCWYCRQAKALLERKGVAYQEHDASAKPELREEARRRSGRHTVPQVFIAGEAVGGYDDLAALDAAGELDAKLAD
ncbi:MAG: glutaredoxin 3 [Myxococcales bacterium]|nr:glutaredoxin 3 [Myxococcales bacterium]